VGLPENFLDYTQCGPKKFSDTCHSETRLLYFTDDPMHTTPVDARNKIILFTLFVEFTIDRWILSINTEIPVDAIAQETFRMRKGSS
jgi:hypothetical protein